MGKLDGSSAGPLSILTFPICSLCYFKGMAVDAIATNVKNYRRLVRSKHIRHMRHASRHPCILCMNETEASCTYYFFLAEKAIKKQKIARLPEYCLEIFTDIRPQQKTART